MSNVKHKSCAMRTLAKSAKARLSQSDYDSDEIGAPSNISPAQKAIYVKLCKLYRQGKSVTNPVQEFADSEKMQTLSHEEKQRYILALCSDYMCAKSYADARFHDEKRA